MNIEKTSVAKAVRLLRERHGLSQEDLARRIGWKLSYASRIETSKVAYPRLDTIFKIADAFGITVEDFIQIILAQNGNSGDEK